MPSVPITIGKAISMLRSAIVNARIYPAGSPMLEASLQGAHQALVSCLQEESPIVITESQGKLCVNGKEVAEAKEFSPILMERDVQALKFLKGLEASEVTSLVEGMDQRTEAGAKTKSLAHFLREQGCKHVEVSAFELVPVNKAEAVSLQMLQILEDPSLDVPALAAALENAFRMMEQVPDEAGRREIQQKVVDRLATLSTRQLKELFEIKLQEKAQHAPLRGALIDLLGGAKLKETLAEITSWHDKLRQESKSELDVVEKLVSLKNFLGNVLHAPVNKAVPFALYEELLSVGVLKERPHDTPNKAESSTLLAEVERLCALPPEELLEPAARQRLPELLRGLCSVGHEESLQRLTEKLLENLPSRAAVVREMAVKLACIFQGILAANRKEKLFMRIVRQLHEMAETEESLEVYAQIVQGLQVGATELLVNWRFEECAMLLSTLRRHSREESQHGEKKRLLCSQALKEFSTHGLDVLCADLNAPLKDRQNGSFRVLAELGEEAVEPLVEAVKRSNDPRARQAAIQALKRLGPTVRPTLLKQITLGISAEALLKLIPVLEYFADASLLPTLAIMLQHPDGGVRRSVAQLLAKVDEPKAQALLTSLVEDSNPEVQAEAVRLIGFMRYKSAVPAMAAKLLNMPAAIQEEMCIAFGNIADKQVVPELIRLLHDKGSFLRKNSGTSDAVRLRAAWALGQLLPDPVARQALNKLLKEPNANMQRVVHSALNRPIAKPRGDAAFHAAA